MLTKPEKVEVTPASSTVDIISQQVYFVEKKEKKDKDDDKDEGKDENEDKDTDTPEGSEA